jgi:tetratricopeptide (TPR) repeat protein
MDERFTFQDKNLWFSDYESERPLSLENYLNIARYRTTSQIGDFGVAYSALKKCLQMDSGNTEALAMLARIAPNMGLGDQESRDAHLRQLRTMAESNPQDLSMIFDYVSALVDNYRVENTVVHQLRMDEAVEVLKRCLTLARGQEKQLNFVLASILTGAGRYTEAAEVYKDLLPSQKASDPGSAILSDKELVYRIAESYYNAGSLAEAEEYAKRSQSLDPGNSASAILLKKIPLKRYGIR